MAKTRTFSVDQAVPQIPAPSRRWLIEKLRSGEFPGRKIGREWRMTDEDIIAAIGTCKNDRRVADTPRRLTPRSRAGATH